jgi:hypothetical protein
MTALSMVVIGLGLIGVFGLFWWLVELSGGVAAGALSVSRAIQSGFAGWRGREAAANVEPAVPDDGDAPPPAGGPSIDRAVAADLVVPVAGVPASRPSGRSWARSPSGDPRPPTHVRSRHFAQV